MPEKKNSVHHSRGLYRWDCRRKPNTLSAHIRALEKNPLSPWGNHITTLPSHPGGSHITTLPSLTPATTLPHYPVSPRGSHIATLPSLAPQQPHYHTTLSRPGAATLPHYPLSPRSSHNTTLHSLTREQPHYHTTLSHPGYHITTLPSLAPWQPHYNTTLSHPAAATLPHYPLSPRGNHITTLHPAQKYYQQPGLLWHAAAESHEMTLWIDLSGGCWLHTALGTHSGPCWRNVYNAILETNYDSLHVTAQELILKMLL